MDNKIFMVYVEGEGVSPFKYTSKESAEKEAYRLANKLNKKAFVMETYLEAAPDEINIKVNSYEAALEYLGRKNEAAYMFNVTDKHKKAISAMYRLITIAEAWNKADKFVPDFDNTNQPKWFPWFRKQGAGGFVSAPTYTTDARVHAYLGSRLCFKTGKRAIQFGEQFIDLWNDFLSLG